MAMMEGTIERINGSLVVAKFKAEPKMGDLVEVGNLKLMGEIVRLSEETAYIQVYETTSGLKPGEPVLDIGTPLIAELGPGIMSQIMDGVETYRELAGGLMDVYLSSIGNRQNEVMKVLTIMASIFIPLTFMAGIYGMNFENMPELRIRWGYPFLLAAMVLVAAGMAVYFRHKGWLGGRPPERPESEA